MASVPESPRIDANLATVTKRPKFKVEKVDREMNPSGDGSSS